MPGHLDDGKVTFSERLLQVVHTSDIATIVLGWSDRIRFADHAAAVLHRLCDPPTHPDNDHNHRSTQTGGFLTFWTETIAI